MTKRTTEKFSLTTAGPQPRQAAMELSWRTTIMATRVNLVIPGFTSGSKVMVLAY